MFLTADEVAELTNLKQRAAQIRALRSMGIDHLVRPDGSPVVMRETLTKLLGEDPSPRAAEVEPNWSALNG